MQQRFGCDQRREEEEEYRKPPKHAQHRDHTT
jgi:hypothetical protein